MVKLARSKPTVELVPDWTPMPNESQYLAALAEVRYFNDFAQIELDKAREAGYGYGMQVGVEERFVMAFKVVQRWENRNWFSRHFGSKTVMIELV